MLFAVVVVILVDSEAVVKVVSRLEVGDDATRDTQEAHHWNHVITHKEMISSGFDVIAVIHADVTGTVPVHITPANTQHWPYLTGRQLLSYQR